MLPTFPQWFHLDCRRNETQSEPRNANRFAESVELRAL